MSSRPAAGLLGSAWSDPSIVASAGAATSAAFASSSTWATRRARSSSASATAACASADPSPPRFRLTPSRLSEPGGPGSANAARLSDELIQDFDPMRRSFLRSERAMNHGSFSS